MPESVTNAVAVQDKGPANMIIRNRGSLAAVLPTHVNAQAWCRLAVGALKRDPKVLEAAQNDTTAFWGAIMTAAQQGLTPGTDEFYLTPRRKKKGAPPTIQGITGYQGYIELMYRAGAVSSVVVEVVREHDTFTYVPGRDERPVHEIDWDADDRGPLRLVYAYAVMQDGATSKVVVLNKGAVARIKAKSDSVGYDWSPWQTNEESMWLKSAVRQLRKWVPTSAEFIRERLRAAQQVASETAPTAGEQPPAEPPAPAADQVTPLSEVVDAEIVDDEPEGWQ